MNICVEGNIFLSNTFFQHDLIYMFTWARGNGKSLTDYRVVDNENLMVIGKRKMEG